MIVYIHGFGSSGFSKKAQLLEAYFGKKNILSPSLSYIPELAIDTLNQIIEKLYRYEEITLVGSSLGGYYATYLSSIFGLKAVLVNPSVYPYRTLAKNIGFNHAYHDGSDYAFIQKHIDALKEYEVDVVDFRKFLVLLQSGDEVLNYQEAQEKYHDSQIVVEEGGNHSFENFETKMEMIERFMLS